MPAETLFLEPQTGQFDVRALAKFVSTLGNAGEDPLQPNMFAIFSDQDEAATFADERLADPKGTLPYVCLIRLTPNRVTVNQLCVQAELAFAKQVVAWLLSRYPVRVT